MPGSVDQVELVGLAVAGLVHQANGLCFDVIPRSRSSSILFEELAAFFPI